jgi:hypothetical protein
MNLLIFQDLADMAKMGVSLELATKVILREMSKRQKGMDRNAVLRGRKGIDPVDTVSALILAEKRLSYQGAGRCHWRSCNPAMDQGKEGHSASLMYI